MIAQVTLGLATPEAKVRGLIEAEDGTPDAQSPCGECQDGSADPSAGVGFCLGEIGIQN